MMYADLEYYKNIHNGTLTDEEATKGLKQASRHIDSLTFNRIQQLGYENLTSFQKQVIQDACCLMCDFEASNADFINSLLSSYSLNGASMSFTGVSANATIQEGIVVQRDVYAYLSQTGLCCKSMRWRV